MGLDLALRYQLNDAHSCFCYEDWGTKFKYSVEAKSNEKSEYYDFEIKVFQEERGIDDSCDLFCIHSYNSKDENGYYLVSKTSKHIFSISRGKD